MEYRIKIIKEREEIMLGRAKHRFYKENMVATCCDCGKKKSVLHYQWTEVKIGIDYIGYRCPECQAKLLKQAEREV